MEREFILEIQWFHVLRFMYKDIQLLPYYEDYSGACHISIPNITNEDLLVLKLMHPNFQYREV